MFAIVINNGLVIDPFNKINNKMNLGISKGKIACISKETLRGNTEINAESLIVTPGFVDMHMHEDPYNEEEDSFEFCISNSMLSKRFHQLRKLLIMQKLLMQNCRFLMYQVCVVLDR